MDGDPADLRQIRRLFLAGLGGVFLCAFGSVAVQVDGLIGPDGIMPAADYLARARDYFGGAAPFRIPSLFWLGAGRFALHFVCGLGVLFSALLISGFAPRLCLAVLWALYLSISTVGNVFFVYQWDILLIEASACAFFIAPGGWTPAFARKIQTSRLGLFLVRLLLARLFFLSGATKWLSGDPTWREGTALHFHFWTQPLPTVPAWWADRIPYLLLQGGTYGTLLIELVLPLFVFAPRPFRRVAFVGFIGLQLVIGATGSYGFFNLLTCVLCLTLLEDRDLADAKHWIFRRVRARDEEFTTPSTLPSIQRTMDSQLDSRGEADIDVDPPVDRSVYASWRMHFRRARRSLAVSVMGIFILLAIFATLGPLGLSRLVPEPVRIVQQKLAPFRSFNGYGLFAVMTTERLEIEVEGSADGETWRPYVFIYKPDLSDRVPRLAMPHMPRLDWQMWFASLRGCEGSPWFHQFLLKLLEGNESVSGLLAENPFSDEPPRYLRTPASHARFAGPDRDDGSWWSYEAVGHFCSTSELRGGRLVRARL
jgi:uncharacterized membrane protein YphA (DoxX/SURF4 family)